MELHVALKRALQQASCNKVPDPDRLQKLAIEVKGCMKAEGYGVCQILSYFLFDWIFEKKWAECLFVPSHSIRLIYTYATLVKDSIAKNLNLYYSLWNQISPRHGCSTKIHWFPSSRFCVAPWVVTLLWKRWGCFVPNTTPACRRFFAICFAS